MARDFLTSQTRVGKIIGNNTPESEPKLIVYSDENASNNTGGFSAGLQSRLNNISTDTFIYIDGIPGSKKLGTANTVAVFGGDVVIKGNLYVDGNECSMWEPDPNDPNSLIPTNTIDGDTGLFAMNFEPILDIEGNISFANYTMTNREFAVDKFFEFDENNNVIPKS